MTTDSIPNASITVASSNAKDFSKKKRANRSAKLKQHKLDARREQWLSRVKNSGGFKEEVIVREGTCGRPLVHLEIESDCPREKLEVKPRAEEDNYGDGLSIPQYSDSELSPLNSPTSHTSSVLGSNDSGSNFTGSRNSSCRSSNSSCRSSSSSSNGCFSGSMSEEDEGYDDDRCLDDWEAKADALAANDNKQKEHNASSGSNSPSPGNYVDASHVVSGSELTNQRVSRIDSSMPKSENRVKVVHKAPVNRWAWKPDDASRPRILPKFLKQYSFPLNPERHLGIRGSVWGHKNVGQVPTSCPICCEDFDFTDLSFLPCSCGFHLCLFCHKRILEENGRCPSCRKQYDNDPVEGEATLNGGSLTSQMARSGSMITRS